MISFANVIPYLSQINALAELSFLIYYSESARGQLNKIYVFLFEILAFCMFRKANVRILSLSIFIMLFKTSSRCESIVIFYTSQLILHMMSSVWKYNVNAKLSHKAFAAFFIEMSFIFGLILFVRFDMLCQLYEHIVNLCLSVIFFLLTKKLKPDTTT